MPDRPFSLNIQFPEMIPNPYDNHIRRTLSSMKGQYLDQQAYQQMLAKEDPLLYEVYELKRPEVVGELLMGISHIYPGKVGEEFFMTKGHFHTVLDTAEMYYTLKGEGIMVMETPEGDCQVEDLRPGQVLYVPPRWAHRSVNTGREVLAFFFAYPANAGHDYGTIEKQGFRKLVVERNGQVQIIDNPRWSPPESRS